MILTLDIETLPDQSPGARDTYLADARTNLRVPSTLTKEQAAKDLGLTDASEIKFTSKDAMIARWQDEIAASKAEEVGDENWRKTSFDGMYGSIACICYAFDDGPVFSQDANDSDGEEGLLCNFYAHVQKVLSVEYVGGVASQSLVVCGHNVHAFDLPFLYHRSVILGVKPVPSLIRAMRTGKFDPCIADTMLMWSSDSQKRVSMDKMCKALHMEGKGDIDGSMVADLWLTDPGKVVEYCKGDVERTRAMYKRLTFADSVVGLRVAA